MGFGVHAGVVEEFEKTVATGGIFGLDHVKMKNVASTGRLERQREIFRALETRGVTGRRGAAKVVPGVDMLELCAEDGRVDVVLAAVEAEAVNVAGVGTVVAKLADAGIEIGIIGDNRAAVAECAEVLLDDEAGCGGVAQL